MKLLIIFIVLSVLNVVLNTLKSIWTVNGGKLIAATINAITFFVYTYVIIYTNCELPMFLKASVTAVCNFIGVYVVKLIEEKLRKDKLWEVKLTLPNYAPWREVVEQLKILKIPCNYIDIDKYILINCYCATQAESLKVKGIVDKHGAKYFVSESKTL